jgi:hypothetical protein
MPGDLVIFDLGKLGEAAKTLVERAANAGWVLHEPTYIRRKAQAEVDADRIRSLGEVRNAALVDRALAREERKQRNAARVTAGAIGLLKADAKPQEVNEDWLAHLFEHASLVSDSEMQSLWSKILAGEANSPGTFSRRTLQVVSALEKRDAHLITALCRFVWVISDEWQPIVHDFTARVYTDADINFDTLVHLDALGIVRFEPAGHIVLERMRSPFEASYFGARFSMELPDTASSKLHVGTVALTSVGKELARISGASSVDGFAEYCIGHFWPLFRVTASHLSAPEP